MNSIWKNDYTKKVISHVYQTYGDELEFLWPKFPNNAIWRRKDSGKWYAALLVVSKKKLGIDSDDIVEIINLRMDPEMLIFLVDNKKYYPGYHMNKRHWCTIILDGSVPLEEIYARIDESFVLARK